MVTLTDLVWPAAACLFWLDLALIMIAVDNLIKRRRLKKQK